MLLKRYTRSLVAVTALAPWEHVGNAAAEHQIHGVEHVTRLS